MKSSSARGRLHAVSLDDTWHIVTVSRKLSQRQKLCLDIELQQRTPERLIMHCMYACSLMLTGNPCTETATVDACWPGWLVSHAGFEL